MTKNKLKYNIKNSKYKYPFGIAETDRSLIGTVKGLVIRILFSNCIALYLISMPAPMFDAL